MIKNIKEDMKMIPAGKKFVPYTYKSFSRDDLKIDPSLDIKSVDNI